MTGRTVDLVITGAPLDDVFKALADPTRLAVVERLGAGPASTSELASPFAMALPSFTQHLDVLERSGLVASTKQGRIRTYRLTPAPLERAGAWLADQREHTLLPRGGRQIGERTGQPRRRAGAGRGGDPRIADLRIQAIGREIEVVIHRHLHRFVHGQAQRGG